MKNAVIVHGKPSKEEYYSAEYPSASNFQWLPWLQKQLLMKDIEAVTPEMFLAYNPDYSIWKREFERYDIGPDTVLVGHSCGGGFLVRWLSENKNIKVGKVVLVAPWLDLEKSLNTSFFEFEIDAELASRTRELVVFSSNNDDEDIQESVKAILDTIKGSRLREFSGYGHFIIEHMGQDKFPELLDEILN